MAGLLAGMILAALFGVVGPTAHAASKLVFAAARQTTFRQCPPITGPTWAFPADNFTDSDLAGTSISSNQYETYEYNFSCAKAAPLIKVLISEVFPAGTKDGENWLTGNPPGVTGFTCVGFPDLNLRLYGGSCWDGAVKFAWNYNVVWHAPPLAAAASADTSAPAGTAGLPFEPMGGAEYSRVLTSLGGGKYKLVILNTSAIGYITMFSYTPPSELTIGSLTSVSATGGTAKCSLSGGTISCKGSLDPPECTCSATGGSVTILFTASGDAAAEVAGVRIDKGLGLQYIDITGMKPVPYLIPSDARQVKPGV